jgi:ribosomal protein L37AE/L43A
MSRINDKLGLGAAGHRKRLDALSGVKCPNCPHHDVISNTVSGRLVWLCGWCGNVWSPTAAEVAAYNVRVRERDRITV